MQNRIISHCFSTEFHIAKDMQSLKQFKERLYNYKNLIGTNDNYKFYNDFYLHTMVAIEEKMDRIAKEILIENPTTALTIVQDKQGIFGFFKRLFINLRFRSQRNLL